MGNTPVQQPTKHENSLEKEWSAGSTKLESQLIHPKGMIPCCVGAENNVGYILLAEQPIYPTSAWQATTETKSDFNRHCGGWNPLWGCADDTDVDMQHTAAREAEEEARMAVGTLSFIRELLLDPRAYSIIFTGRTACNCPTNSKGCFLAGYGTLTKAERKKIVDYHKKKCLTTPYNKFSWEVKQLKWFRVADLQKECLAAKGLKLEFHLLTRKKPRGAN